MKNFTFAFLSFFAFSFGFSQTYTTGVITFVSNEDLTYTAKIDIENDVVTLTLNGPDERFLGIGFGVQSMTSGGDALIWRLEDGTLQLTDRTFGYPGQPDGEDATGLVPYLDSSQDWTVVTNSLDVTQRTVVATRAVDTGEAKDYVFSTADTYIDMVWSVGFSYGLIYHGENRGIVMEPITLSQREFSLNQFKIIQNPSSSKLMLSLSNSEVKLDVFDVLGKKILTKELSGLTSSIDVSKWNSGVYLIRVTSDTGTQTKRFLKQ